MIAADKFSPDFCKLFTTEGLYLILEDNTRIECTRENIENYTQRYWDDPDKIAPNVREAMEFQRCPFCPLKGQRDLCDALRPVLPLLDTFEK